MKTLSDLAFNGLASPTAAVQFNRSRTRCRVLGCNARMQTVHPS